MDNVEWHKANDNELGIETIAFTELDKALNVGRIVGYNGILKGDKVLYRDKEYTVVMVSRLGHIGLSKTGNLPYTETSYPTELTKV